MIEGAAGSRASFERHYGIWAGLAALMLLAAWLRVPSVHHNLLFGDEIASLRLIGSTYREILTTYGQSGSGLALPLLQRILSDLLGRGHWAFRLPALTGGLATLFLVFFVGRRLVGTQAALLAAFALSVNPQQIFYSHFGRTYTLVAALGLVLVGALQGIAETDTPSRRTWVAVVLASGLLPWVHMTSLALVVPAAAGAMVSVLWSRSTKRQGRLLAALAGGGALAFALYAPALKSMAAFVRTKTTQEYYGSFSVPDIFALLAGGRAEGWILLVGSVLGGGLWVLRHRSRSLVLPAAVLGTPLCVLVANAYGGPYAQARYMIGAVPLMLLLVAWLWEQLVRGSPAILRAPLWAGAVALVAASFLAGPRGPYAPDDGPFGNTYLALFGLSPFDVPSPATPLFFRELTEANAGDRIRIIEAPWLRNRSVHLYRNYYLQRPRRTLIGLFSPGTLQTWVPEGPYVRLYGPRWSENLDADYLVVHRRLRQEVEAYWRMLYGSDLKRQFPREIAAYMERHRVSSRRPPSLNSAVEARLRGSLGEPTYEDGDLLVWRLGR